MAVSGVRRTILHYPRLDTVLMVEQFIRARSGEYRKRALWERLPKKMMYNTFQTVFDYLLASGKIATDPDGKVCWIWNPALVRRYLKDATLAVR